MQSIWHHYVANRLYSVNYDGIELLVAVHKKTSKIAYKVQVLLFTSLKKSLIVRC